MSETTLQQDGIILIDKPTGISSFDVIRHIKRKLKNHYELKHRQLPKLGHGGTLDPFASGLLIVLMGKAVKLAKYMQHSPKGYLAKMVFGQKTMSADTEQEVCESTESIPNSLEEISLSSQSFCQGTYLQTPPMFSAKKINNKRLYVLARRGLEVEREAVECQIHSLNILDYSAPQCEFDVTCSAGTYIRTLAEDLAERLHSLAHLNFLRRTQSGPFSVDHALSLEAWDKIVDDHTFQSSSTWIPFDNILQSGPCLEVDQILKDHLIHGRQLAFKSWIKNINRRDTPYLAIYHEGKLCAILENEDKKGWRLSRAFVD